jgi:hypothetical protein
MQADPNTYINNNNKITVMIMRGLKLVVNF